MKRKILLVFLLMSAVASAAIIFVIKNETNRKIEGLDLGNEIKSETEKVMNKIEDAAVSSDMAASGSSEAGIPSKALLDVPFLSQAPFANWDALHEDACEEASLAIVKFFKDGVKSVSREKAEEEIQKMIAYEEKNGYGISVTLDELNIIARDYYGFKTGRVEKEINIDDIKKELAADRPVIVPAAGKILPNPNFRNGGPNYHMLVVKGYDSKYFITNDPGTRKGEGFKYTFNELFNAIHDWNPQDIYQGQKAYLVFD